MPSRIAVLVDSKRRSGGKKDSTRHTKRLILIYGSVHVRCVYESCGDVKQTLPKMLFLAQGVRDYLRHDRMAGAELHKQRKTRARLPLDCPVNFSFRTILFLRAAWMKPPRESLAMLVHTSVYWANSQSSCDAPRDVVIIVSNLRFDHAHQIGSREWCPQPISFQRPRLGTA